MVDLSLRIEFEKFAPCLDGLYAQAFTTLVYSRWDLGSRVIQQTPTITCDNEKFLSFPPCYMATKQATAAKDLETVFNGDYLFGECRPSGVPVKLSLDEH